MKPDDSAADAKPPEVQPPASGDHGGVGEGMAPSSAASREASSVASGEAELPTDAGAPVSASDGSEVPLGGSPLEADNPPEAALAEHAPATVSHPPVEGQPTFLLFGVVASVSLLLDVISKGWAEVTLINRPTTPITLIENHLSLTLAYNPGGAWGLLTSQSEDIRKPFFVFVSVAAILFIVSLYGRLAPGQKALTWGLPLVLGGALGNLADRITRSQVIDFIDYRADWVRTMNEWVAKYFSNWSVTDHWPTFNVADIAICVGVGLMAIDMVTSRRGPHPHRPAPKQAPGPGSGAPDAEAQAPSVAPTPAPEGPQPQS